MKVSASGLRLIEVFEGLRLEAYPDPGSGGAPWTIGIGTTIYPDGRAVQPGDRITEQQAREFLAHDVAQFEAAVARLVTVPVTQSQFDALVSLAYNIGAGALERSTLLAKLNAGDYAGAAGEFNRWTNASGRELPGLVRRRRAERTLFEADIGAPIENRTAPPAPAEQPRTPTMAPIIAALLPQLVTLIPELSKLFGSGSAVSNRNIAATEAVAQRVAEVVTQATDAPNVQGAVESMQADPAKLEAARAAVRREWFDLQSRSVADARKFVTEYGQTKNVRTVVGKFTFPELLSLVFIGLASLGVGYLMVSRQLGGELLGGVVTLMLIGGWTEIRKFWFGLGAPEGEQPARREP